MQNEDKKPFTYDPTMQGIAGMGDVSRQVGFDPYKRFAEEPSQTGFDYMMASRPGMYSGRQAPGLGGPVLASIARPAKGSRYFDYVNEMKNNARKID